MSVYWYKIPVLQPREAICTPLAPPRVRYEYKGPPVLTGLQYDTFREVELKIDPSFAMAVGPDGSPGSALSGIKEECGEVTSKVLSKSSVITKKGIYKWL